MRQDDCFSLCKQKNALSPNSCGFEVYKNDELSNITVTEATGISENEQLAYLRAMGVKDYLDRNIPAFGKMRTTFDTYIEVSQNKGGAYRRIGVKLTFVDAL